MEVIDQVLQERVLKKELERLERIFGGSYFKDHLERVKSQLGREPRRLTHPQEYYPRVYFIADGDWVKIGWSRDPVGIRMVDLQRGNPRRLTFYGSIWGDRTTEGILHEKLAVRRGIGEWFRLSREECEAIIGEGVRCAWDDEKAASSSRPS